MTVKREPTHMLTVTVPLHLADSDRFDYRPLQETLNVVMVVSRLAVDRVVCGDVDVDLKSTTDRVLS